MPSTYQRRGFVREEIFSMGKYEKESGVVHEASNFLPGNEPAPLREPSSQGAPAELRDRLIDDLRAASQSGPWTTNENQPLQSFNIDAPL